MAAAPAAPPSTTDPEYLAAVLADLEGYAQLRARKLRLPWIAVEDRAQAMRLAVFLAAQRFRGCAFEDRRGFVLYLNYFINDEVRWLTAKSFPDHALPVGSDVPTAAAVAMRLRQGGLVPRTPQDLAVILPAYAAKTPGVLRAVLALAARPASRPLDAALLGSDHGQSSHDLLGEEDPAFAAVESREAVRELLALAERCLPPRFLRYLLLYHGLDNPARFPLGRTLEAVAATFNVSRQAVNAGLRVSYEVLRRAVREGAAGAAWRRAAFSRANSRPRPERTRR